MLKNTIKTRHTDYEETIVETENKSSLIIDELVQESLSRENEKGKRRNLSGHLKGIDNEGRVLFQAEDSSEIVPVIIGLEMSDHELVKAARCERRALVLVTEDRDKKYVLISCLRERIQTEARNDTDYKVKIDGDTLQLHARERIELVCGKARIVMTKDGRIEQNGNYLISRSCGPIKLKGASIEVN